MYKKIEKLCEDNGISVTSLTEKIGITSANVTHWKNGSRPRPQTLKKIADYFGVPIEYFSNDDLTKDLSLPTNATPINSFIRVPIIGRIPAGVPMIAIENIDGYEEIPRSWLNGDPQNYFVLRVEGDSMENVGIFDGDLAILKRCSTCDNGQICAVGIKGETPDLYATLKRVFLIDEDYIELVPENNKYPRRKLKRSEVNIFGVVRKSMRSF